MAGGGIFWVEVFTHPFASRLRIRAVCLGIRLSRNANVPTIASYPTGNANSRQAMQALAEAGLLAELHTSIATFQGNALDQISGLPGFGELRRRAGPSSLHSGSDGLFW